MLKQSNKSFNAPIPGMSLTTEPGNRPWENPPDMTDVEDVLDYYIDRLGDSERTDQFLSMIEKNIPINTIVESLVSAGAMNGLHTVESGMLAAPVLSEFLISVAEIEGMEYVTSPEELSEGKMRPDQSAKLEDILQRGIEERMDVTTGGGEEEGIIEEEDSQEEPMRKGLMARPVAMVAEVESVEIPDEEAEKMLEETA